MATLQYLFVCCSTALDYEDHIKDLGVTFDEKLDISVYIVEKLIKCTECCG